MKRFFLFLTMALLAAGIGWAWQRNFDDVRITATHVAGNVHMLQGSGGNIGVTVGSDGILIVDDQFAPLADRIRAALKKLNPGQLRFVLNTHWHGDHTGGNPEFGPEATIVAHTNVRKRLSTDQTVRGRHTPAMAEEGWPVITFDESLSIHFNGEEIRVIHLPKGHTDGDSVIYFSQSNVLHLGDHYFKDRFPFVDLGSGGNAEGLEKNIARAISMAPADVRIIPGHGSLASLDDLKRYHQMLVETIGLVRDKKAAGKDLESVKSEGLPSKWDDWGSGFIDTPFWIETIYRSLD